MKIKTLILQTTESTDIVNNTKGILYYNYKERNFKGNISCNEIYISDDSIIKEGDWFVKNDMIIYQANDNIKSELESNKYYGIDYKKIIATTDKILINDGVLNISTDDVVNIIELYNAKKLDKNLIIDDNDIQKNTFIKLKFRNYVPVENSESKIISEAFAKIHAINKDKQRYSKEDVSTKIYEALAHFAQLYDITIDESEIDKWIGENLK